MHINRRFHLPIKTATTLTLVIVFSLYLGWDKSYWAAFPVIMLAITETRGHSLKKGRHRIIGTVIGSIVAFILISLFSQKPFLFFIFYSCLVFICVYNQSNADNGYIWLMGLVVASIIIVIGDFSPERTFNIAMLRIQETILGVFCFSLVFGILWPNSSSKALFSLIINNYKHDNKRIEYLVNKLFTTDEFKKNIILSEYVTSLARLDDLLKSAKVDSYRVNANCKSWDVFYRQQEEWVILCGQLSEIILLLKCPINKMQKDIIIKVLLNIRKRNEVTINELIYYDYNSFVKADRTFFLKPLLIDIKNLEIKGNDRITSFLYVLQKIEILNYEQQKTIFNILNGNNIINENCNNVQGTKKIKINPTQLINAFKVCIIYWICVLLYVFIPISDGMIMIFIGTLFGSVTVSMPCVNPISLLFYIIIWSVFALIQYIFLLPFFTEIWQIILFYFINTFIIWYVFDQNKHILHRLFGLVGLILTTKNIISLTPVYDIKSILLTLVFISISFFVIFFVNYSVYSSQPESVLLRQLNQFKKDLAIEIRCILINDKEPFYFFQSPVKSILLAEVASKNIDWKYYEYINSEIMDDIIDEYYSVYLHHKIFSNYYHNIHDIDNIKIKEMVFNILNNVIIIINKTEREDVITKSIIEINNFQNELKIFIGDLNVKHDNLNNKQYYLITSLFIFTQSMGKIIDRINSDILYELKSPPFIV